MNSKFLIVATPDSNDTILIVNGFEDDPLCDEIRMLAAANMNLENPEMTHRPDAPAVKISREKTRVFPALHGLIKWILGLPHAVLHGKKTNSHKA